MSDILKAALVIGVAIISAAAAQIYFSPYQTCVRTAKSVAPRGSVTAKTGYAEIYCAPRSH